MLKEKTLPFDELPEPLDLNSTREQLVAALLYLANHEFNINSVFDPSYSIYVERNEGYDQHFCEDIVELTSIHNEYIDKGYTVKAVDWTEGKIATFYVTR